MRSLSSILCFSMLTALPFPSVDALRGKRVLVFGLGTKGGSAAAARWLAEHGAAVTVTDRKSVVELADSLRVLEGLPIALTLGEHREDDIRAADIILRNPAVPLDAPLLKLAQSVGKVITMDVALFFQFCPAPIAGITGTRGKSTTAVVAAEILRRKRRDTVLAGNIEHSPLADLDRMRSDTPVVLELSSWQLESLEPMRRSPHWGLLTTLLPDHLNRYPSMDAYVAAKRTIVQFQTPNDVAVLPVDDIAGEQFAALTPARTMWFGVPGGSQRLTGDREGLFRIGEAVVLRREEHEQALLRWAELGGTGDHTKRNMLAGALLAIEMGAPLEDVVAVLRAFRGIPNRLEVVRELDGRTFVNDTAATTPEAVVAALAAFPGKQIVLMTGGTDKNLDYRGLTSLLGSAKQLRAVVLLAGSATEKLRSALGQRAAKNTGRERSSASRSSFLIPPSPVQTMPEAVALAWKASQPGDVVLLSPGAASFELFRDEFDRGDQFRAAVAALP